MVATFLGSLLEMAAFALISPLIAVLLDENAVYTDPFIGILYRWLGISELSDFLAFLAFALGGLYLIRGIYVYVISHYRFRFIAGKQMALATALLDKFMSFSYLYHTKQNMAHVQQTITQDVNFFFTMINMLIALFGYASMAGLMFVFLMIVSPVMTVLTVILTAICGLIYLKGVKSLVKKAGEETRTSNIAMLKTVNQALGGIKEVKVLKREPYFLKTFKKASYFFARATAKNNAVNVLPQLIIETVIFGGAFLILAMFILMGADIQDLVPQLSLFVLAAFRLLPNISRMINAYNTFLYYRPSVNAIYDSLTQEDIVSVVSPQQCKDGKALSANDIVIENLTFRYPDTPADVLVNVDLRIQANTFVAFIGPSGSGKSTLIDIILGAIQPDKGGVYFQGSSVHANHPTWNGSVGYIPQQIYLLDESIAENIAFGIDKNEIDQDKLKMALERAQLKTFVDNLEHGIDTIVGDRGVRLSGGQRQRIGIARALYLDPPILVLDEATSALDNETEQAVMEAIEHLQGEKTLIVIAHRLSTIEKSDTIYRVEGGRVTVER